tara:strand:+ start:507 stop:803 length:297 start_codon:yes stop_codon:yes gene_type:complete
MSSYGNDSKPVKKKRGRPKKVTEPVAEPAPAPAPAPVKKSRSGGKLTDKQREGLKKHMEKMAKGGMSSTEMKSHRMKLMSRMRKGMTVDAAHKDVMKK